MCRFLIPLSLRSTIFISLFSFCGTIHQSLGVSRSFLTPNLENGYLAYLGTGTGTYSPLTLSGRISGPEHP